MSEFLSGPWTIALYTWREGIRKKTVLGFLILSILLIFGASFITEFMMSTSISETNIETDTQSKLIKDICVATISIFGILITIFASASVIPSEVENKVIYTVLSKPIRRYQYLLGKFIGVQMIILINLAVMGGLFFFALYFKEKAPPTLLLWSLLLTYVQFLIVSAFTFAVSCTATSAVLPTIGGLFIYLSGLFTPYLKDVVNRSGQTDTVLDAMIGKTAYALSQILPNLKDFDIRNQVVYMAPNDPPAEVMIPNLVVYGLVYTFSGFLLAYWIFRRKEL
jgi:ABC-type transport system involved in multi-copper enzyme maturation permease subunit